MATRKTAPKASSRALLSENFMRALEADFERNGVKALEQMREKSPERFCELAAKLITAVEAPDGQGIRSARSLEEVGERLLLSVGAAAETITPEMIAEAKAANETFISTLERIVGTTNAHAQQPTNH